jgi:PAS domain S-box-containing protein
LRSIFFPDRLIMPFLSSTKNFRASAGNRARCYGLIVLINLLLHAPVLLWAEDPPEASSADLTPVTLQLKWKHQFQFAGYYAAKKQGYYREAGLDVTILEKETPRGTVPRVLNGEADFGIAMSDLILMRAEGKPVVALAAIYQHSPLVLLVPKDRGIDNIHALHGQSLMLEAHSEEILAYFVHEGMSISNFYIQPHTFSSEPLISGKVAAMTAYSTDEVFELQQQGVDCHAFSPRSGGIDFYGDVLFTSEDYLQEHPRRVQAFVDASLRGWRYALEHPEEMADHILREYEAEHTREHLLYEARTSRRLILPDIVELGYMNPGRWEHIAAVYRELNMMPGEVDLQEFMYRHGPESDNRALIAGLVAAGTTALIAFLVAGRFHNLNRKLRGEIQSRREAQKQTLERERQLHTLMANLPGMAYRCDFNKDWSMRFVSEGCKELTGYERHRFLGHGGMNFADIIHPQDRTMVWNDVLRAAKEGRSCTLNYRIIRADNAVKWVWEQASVFENVENGEEFVEGFITDITDLKLAQQERERLIDELQNALREIRTLKGILPICSSCKKIRDDRGYWNQIEAYIREHSYAQFSHGICPDCARALYPDFVDHEKSPLEKAEQEPPNPGEPPPPENT